MKGLRINVYSSGGYDATNGGISSQYDHLTLIGPGIPEIFEPAQNAPAVTLAKKNVMGEYLYLVPCDENAQPLPGWYMAGGNFGHTSDSRFPSKYPLSIHDRLEDERARPANFSTTEPVQVGEDLVVKFKGVERFPDGLEVPGTWRQRFDLRTAGYKLAAELRQENAPKIVDVTLEPHYEFKRK